jgi:REP element-mobilizing transposase RayT
MPFTRRHLPHWLPDRALFFVTFRLAGSIPPRTPDILTAANTGRTWLPRDDPPGQPVSGPVWLQDPGIASVVRDALLYGETTGRYTLHAWVIMPNHVHVILEPQTDLPSIMRWLKGRTSRIANRILHRARQPFWQDESFDRWIRSDEELQALIAYTEQNPVSAGLAPSPEAWPWSSARTAADDKK